MYYLVVVEYCNGVQRIDSVSIQKNRKDAQANARQLRMYIDYRTLQVGVCDSVELLELQKHFVMDDNTKIWD